MGNNQVVMVTGCSTGMGRDICEIMSNKGYIVVATARNIDSLKNVPASLKLRLDVTDKGDSRQICVIANLLLFFYLESIYFLYIFYKNRGKLRIYTLYFNRKVC